MTQSSITSVLAIALAWAGPAGAQTFNFNGTRENVNPATPPGGRCVPPFFNTVTIAPGALSSTGASNLGTFTSTQSHCIEQQPPTPLRDGRFTYTFRAGDTITGTYDGAVTESATPGQFNVVENLRITGGTGRFTGASGTITDNGSLRFGPGPSGGQVGIFAGTLTGSLEASATVEGRFGTALGEPSAATGEYSTAVGAFSTATAERGVAVGSFAESTGVGAIALGDASVSSGQASIAIGQGSAANADLSLALGSNAQATNRLATAIGRSAQASGLNALAVGIATQATGMGASALGNGAVATNLGTTAAGVLSSASGTNATAIGRRTTAQGAGSAAFGNLAQATGENSTAVGGETTASALASTALGAQAVASGTASSALGHNSDATALGSTAVGVSAQATQNFATAVGRLANAAHVGSTAIGESATTTAANQVSLGANGSSVRVGDIAASTAAQTGTLSVATFDQNGTLGRNTSFFSDFAAVQSAQAALSGRVDELFDLRQLDRRDMRQGIAAAVAMGHASMPSAPGRTSFVINGAAFRGEQAIGGSILHRLGGATPLAIGAGFSFAGNKNNAVRVGVAGEF